MAGRGRELVVAVEFVAAFAILRAFREDTKASLLEDIQRPPTVLSQAGDGGPIRRTSMTVFTVTALSPLLRKGRTALIPILYILAGSTFCTWRSATSYPSLSRVSSARNTPRLCDR